MPFTARTSRNRGQHGTPMAFLGLLATVAISGPAIGQVDDVYEQNRRCLACHAKPHIAASNDFSSNVVSE